jgi:molecular chaperone GrpE (heat shock protein)
MPKKMGTASALGSQVNATQGATQGEISMAADEVDGPGAVTAHEEGEEGEEGTDEQAEPARGLQVELAERLAAIEGAVAEFNRRSAHREAVIDRLHEENQRLRDGAQRAILEPVVADLIRLHDSLLREVARLGADGADPAHGRLLESFADDMLLTLERCGLEEFTARPGEPFDPARHAAVSVVPADDEALDNTVAEVVASGFVERETGRIRRPVRARFHRFRPVAPAAGDGKRPAPADGPDASAAPADGPDASAAPAETSGAGAVAPDPT